MKVEDLPHDVQKIAAETLRDLMAHSSPNKEQAIELAHSVRSGFIELFEGEST